jgi:hypothetical protein
VVWCVRECLRPLTETDGQILALALLLLPPPGQSIVGWGGGMGHGWSINQRLRFRASSSGPLVLDVQSTLNSSDRSVIQRLQFKPAHWPGPSVSCSDGADGPRNDAAVGFGW